MPGVRSATVYMSLGAPSSTERLTNLLLSWAANAIALAAAAGLLDRVTVHKPADLILAAALFGVLNTILKPFLKLLSLPFAIITFGIAWFFVSMLMLRLTADIVSGFEIDGFRALVWATLIVWVVNLVLDLAPGPWRGTRRRRSRRRREISSREPRA
jgi:putative membrane protein